MRVLVGVLALLGLIVVASAANSHSGYVELQNAELYCTPPYPGPPVVGSAYWQAPKRPLILISGA